MLDDVMRRGGTDEGLRSMDISSESVGRTNYAEVGMQECAVHSKVGVVYIVYTVHTGCNIRENTVYERI